MHAVRRASDMHEGDGARVRRLMPVPGFMNFDPFVLFDDFALAPGTGFPPHPHRGFEAITYLCTGELEHRDNLGNVSRVGPGGAQRFTAGHGIVHSEMPSVAEPTRGIQLWINLPARLKASAPAYQEAGAETMVEAAVAGGVRRVIVGEGGPVALMTPVRYVHYRFTADGEVDGCTIECWLHGSTFDLRTGKPLALPATKPVPVYPVTVDGDRVLVDVDVTI